MADPTRPLTPAPDDSWPAPDDAAVRRLVEALTADATPEELSDEARYIAAFTTLTAPAEPAAPHPAAPPRGGLGAGPRTPPPSPPLPPRPERAAPPARRRGRLVLVPAAAALAVPGTAAAVTGTMGWPTAPPHPRAPSSTTSA